VGADREGDKTEQGERDRDEEEGVREGREDNGT
jgi:hypothetical protein